MLTTTWVALAAGLATCTAPALADTTLGSSLEDKYDAPAFGSAITVFQEVAPGETLAAPANGLITSWKVRSGDEGAQYELRILRPNGSEYVNAGSSEPETVASSNDEVRGPFSANLLVRAGDRIALYVTSGVGAPTNITSTLTDEVNYLSDPFAEGAGGKPLLAPLHGGNQELLLQANFRPGAGALPPPENSGLPTISGEARAPETLTGTAGFWRGNPTAFAYQWLRCAPNATGCEAIAGATATTYALTRTDVGSAVRLHVTATGPTGSASAESAPTATVAPFVIRAVLKISPTATCTGVPVLLDGSASRTPDPPIVSYRYDFIDFPAEILSDPGKNTPVLVGLPASVLFYGSPKPDQVATFTWDRPADYPLDALLGAKPQDWARDTVRIVMSIQDKAGAVASTAQDVEFAQRYSSQPRSGCPKPPAFLSTGPNIFNSTSATLKVTARTVTTTLRCASASPCAGSLKFLAAGLAARGAARRRVRRVVLAESGPFTVAARHTARVNARLTKAGRTLVRRGRAVRAVMQLTSVGVTGSKASRTVRVTLRRR